jgi:hypothetical protein
MERIRYRGDPDRAYSNHNQENAETNMDKHAALDVNRQLAPCHPKYPYSSALKSSVYRLHHQRDYSRIMQHVSSILRNQIGVRGLEPVDKADEPH